ncbi:hypothetical protein [Aminivibrio sp.]|jgi:hypothetical protein|uniref:hypothetical protein n=1 Tax=Aminivibrio sp. TaxID=1872489 RepID=UPI003D95F509
MNYSSQKGKTLSKATENRTLLEQALASSRTMADALKAIQSQLYSGSFKDITKAMQQLDDSTSLSKMLHVVQSEKLFFAEFPHPPRIFEDLIKQISEMRALNESITSPFRAVQKMMQNQSIEFERLSGWVSRMNKSLFTVSDYSQSIFAWNVVSIELANRFNDIGLLSKRELLSARLFAIPNTFATFLRHTTELLGADPTPEMATCLRGSLNLAKHQMLGITDALIPFVKMPDEDERPDKIRDLFVPYKQQDELLNHKFLSDENDVVMLTAISPTAQNEDIARRVLKLIAQCNEAGKTSKYGVEIFKPTNRMLSSFVDLPWIHATDKNRFGDALDCLYFIFYEGSGADNLRFLDKNGGPLTDQDCDFIWCIKRLRNNWIRHDADHGKEKDSQKSWAELSKAFHWLGLTEFPTDMSHFQQIHQRLLILAEEFLRRILNKFAMMF